MIDLFMSCCLSGRGLIAQASIAKDPRGSLCSVDNENLENYIFYIPSIVVRSKPNCVFLLPEFFFLGDAIKFSKN